MKVAFIDNMNNNFFAFSRYLRELGVDAHVYSLQTGFSHFSPEADTFLDVESLDWIHEFPFDVSPKNFLTFKASELDEFREYDVLIGCGTIPAFFSKVGLHIDILIPYGADLYQFPFASFNYRRPLVGIVEQWMAYMLRKAYRKARYVVANDSHSLSREGMKRLGVKNISMPIPMVFNREDSGYGEWDFLRNHDFVTSNHSRQLWSSNPDNLPNFSQHKGNKRNDRVIRAFARFVRTTRYKTPLLLLFEYGMDVEASKALIAELGLEDYVYWSPIKSRKEIMQALRLVDLGTDQFREGLCGYGGTGLEVLASGVPLLTHTAGATSDQEHFIHSSPIIDVLRTDEILGILQDYEQHPEKYKAIGHTSRKWFDENIGEGGAVKYLPLLEDIVKKKKRLHTSASI